MRDNLKGLKKKQQENTQKQEDDAKPKPEPFKMTKFKGVESKLNKTGLKFQQEEAAKKKQPTGMSKKAGMPRPPPNPEGVQNLLANGPPCDAANVMIYNAQTNENIYEYHPPVEQPAYQPPKPIRYNEKEVPLNTNGKENHAENKPDNEKKPIVPRASQKGKLAPRTQKNFLKENKTASHFVKKPEEDDNSKTKNYGKVPTYLKNIKKQREDEATKVRQALENQRDCPPGCMKMADEERLTTLADLQKNSKEIQTILEKMPISMRTQHLERKKDDLEKKLAQTEKAIQMFSKKVVFVAIDQ